jgi:pimeloyl-ACP methyl ester carboxylesterase
MSFIKRLILCVFLFQNENVYAAYQYQQSNMTTLPGDQLLSLTDTGGNFGGVLRVGAGNPAVGLILLHGRGADYTDGHVILPLRDTLNAAGYTTLSIDTPQPSVNITNGKITDYGNYLYDLTANPAPNTVFPELYDRVVSAETELKSLGVQDLILVGFSLGSRMGSAFMANTNIQNPLNVLGFIGVGMGSELTPGAQLLDTQTTIAGINKPVLDLFGSLDQEASPGASTRKNNYNGSSYTQLIISQTLLNPPNTQAVNHQLIGYEDQLTQNVGNWMASYAPLTTPVPLPGAAWLFASTLAGLVGLNRCKCLPKVLNG